MHPAIVDERDLPAEFCRRYDVVRLKVFGPAARDTDFDPATSDAGSLVEFAPDRQLPPLEQFSGLVDALSDALGRPVDLVENHEFRNPHLSTSIKSRELVHAS